MTIFTNQDDSWFECHFTAHMGLSLWICIKIHGVWTDAVKVERSPDGSVSPEERGVRAAYGSRFVVWFGCGTPPQ